MATSRSTAKIVVDKVDRGVLDQILREAKEEFPKATFEVEGKGFVPPIDWEDAARIVIIVRLVAKDAHSVARWVAERIRQQGGKARPADGEENQK